MSVQRFPCRRCHVLVASVDAYVICADCLDALEQEADDELRSAPIDGDAAARLRRLLDGW